MKIYETRKRISFSHPQATNAKTDQKGQKQSTRQKENRNCWNVLYPSRLGEDDEEEGEEDGEEKKFVFI